MLIILGILLLLSLIIIHELGHFWAARRAGIEVEEFGIGFPPRAKVLTKKNGTEYTLNWLPLGGFVKLKGEHDSDKIPGSYGAASLFAKIRVMVAGVFMNTVAAIAILSVIALFGMPKVMDNQFKVESDSKVVQHDVILDVQSDSPAEKAGLIDGDIVKAIVDTSCPDRSCAIRIEKSDDLKGITESLAGKEVIVVYGRDGQEYDEETNVQMLTYDQVEASKQTENPKGYLGVIPADYIKYRSTWSAPIVGTALTFQFFSETLKGLAGLVTDLFHGQTANAGDKVTGVIGIGYLLGELSSQGLMSILFLTAIISISLAVMNILPIPALDGGRLFVTLLFRLFKRPLTKQTEERIHGTGFAILIFLFLIITVLDVKRFIIN